MAKPTKPQDVSNYKHDDARRTMIPTAEQQGFVQEDVATASPGRGRDRLPAV